MIYRFGDFALDTDSLELSQAGAAIEVEPQVFSLLACLIENAERVVSKDELIELVWDGRIVSDGTLNTRINSVRRAVGDDGKTQAVIKTFPRRGFRFVAELDGGGEVEAPRAEAAISDKPSIAVLPFDNLSGDPEQEYFSDGLADDVISALTRFRQLFVVARNSSFAYKGAAADVRNVCRELGVRYVLAGSVRKSGNRVRISVQLMDGENGSQLWSERYDRDLEDIFAVQDEITEAVVGQVEPELTKSEIARAQGKRPENLNVWDLYLRARFYVNRRSVGDIAEAIGILERVLADDPSFAPAYQDLSWAYGMGFTTGEIDETETMRAKGIALAETAMRLDRDDDRSYMALARAYMFASKNEQALPPILEAIKLNPASAFSQYQTGRILIRLGRAEEGIPYVEEALRLSPRDMWITPFLVAMAEGKFLLGNFETAIEWADKALREANAIWPPAFIRIISFIELDRMQDARQAAAEMKQRFPAITLDFVSRHAWWDQLLLVDKSYIEVLREAGVPEE